MAPRGKHAIGLTMDPKTLLARVAGMRAIDIATACVVQALIALSGGRVALEDGRIYVTIDEPQASIRRALIRLVRAGVFVSGDGYLRRP